MALDMPVIASVNFDRKEFFNQVPFTSDEEADRRNFEQQIQNINGDLVSVAMDKLSRVVVIAGPNGSGKSRTLRMIAYAVDRANNNWPGGAPKSRDIQGRIDREMENVVSIDRGLKPMRADIASAPQAITPVRSLTRGDLNQAAHQLERDSANFNANFPRAASMMQRCFDEYWNATHQASKLPTEKKQFLTGRWERLRTVVAALLKKTVHVDDDQTIRIGGIEIDQAVEFFSDGERRLFGLASSLIGQDSQEVRRVILCDEPENHLHPEAAVQVLTSIRDALPTAQLWIATHSVTIIAAMGWENVWVADAGRVSFSGRDTARIVTSLLGGAENIARLRAFMDEPDKAAVAKFAAECLVEPVTAGYSATDPQITQAAQAMPSAKRPKVLDWGAGHGRFAYWLRGQDDPKQFDYFALNSDSKAEAACLSQLQALYDDAAQRLFRTPSDAINHALSGAPFDAVILANVLHEVPIEQWLVLLADIGQSLASDGHLLILEDGEMRVGELPTHEGFLLLNSAACKSLFADTENQIVQVPCKETKYRERLICFQVPKALLANVTKDTIRSSITEIQTYSLSQIEKLRVSGKTGYEAGNRHALHLALYANSGLALQRF